MKRVESFSKRMLDILAALIGLALLAPVLILVAVWVRLDSKGPAFFRSMRIGRNGIPFKMWKFRTMQPNSETQGITTGENDPRVTRLGAILRKYKVDELPQLINVLKGDMSLVGPRPDFEEHTSAYRGDEQLILTVRPGITDYASLQFHNLGEIVGSEDPHRVYIERVRDRKNRLRVAYVKKQSLREDFCILFRTLVRVVARH